MPTVRHALPAAALLLGLAVAPARADRFPRAEALFKHACVSCHTVGWGAPARPEPRKVDLTFILRRSSDAAALRRFLADPAQEKPGSRCAHAPLPRDAVDDLVFFFDLHSRPPPAPQSTPPRSSMRSASAPRSPPPVRVLPRGGQ
jgi:hypothetical protein